MAFKRKRVMTAAMVKTHGTPLLVCMSLNKGLKLFIYCIFPLPSCGQNDHLKAVCNKNHIIKQDN